MILENPFKILERRLSIMERTLNEIRREQLVSSDRTTKKISNSKKEKQRAAEKEAVRHE